MYFHLDEMYAEVCAYLTSYKYLELPNYRVSYLFLSVDDDDEIYSIEIFD